MPYQDMNSALQKLAERRIEEAMRQGKFDNLPGHGQPCELEPMPADENARMVWWALRMMKRGGRTAEELIFHEPTTGAANDIEKATQIARGMITEYGMSERLGARKFGNGDGEPFLGRDMSHSRDYSDEIASSIDEEIHRLIESAHDEAWEVLVQYRDVLDALVLRLLDKETVARTEVLEIFASVEKRPVRGSYTGYGKRLPSDRPPVLSPKELALAAADGGAGNGNMALPANGQSFGFTPSDTEPSDTE